MQNEVRWPWPFSFINLSSSSEYKNWWENSAKAEQFVFISCFDYPAKCQIKSNRIFYFELRFMNENGQGHLTLFCIVFVWLRGRPIAVRSHCIDLWFMYQNRLGPSGGIYYPNFVPCFVYHQLNFPFLFEKIVWTKIPTKNLIDSAHWRLLLQG